MKNSATLLVDCPDRKGIVAAVSDFLYRQSTHLGEGLQDALLHRMLEVNIVFERRAA